MIQQLERSVQYKNAKNGYFKPFLYFLSRNSEFEGKRKMKKKKNESVNVEN